MISEMLNNARLNFANLLSQQDCALKMHWDCMEFDQWR